MASRLGIYIMPGYCIWPQPAQKRFERKQGSIRFNESERFHLYGNIQHAQSVTSNKRLTSQETLRKCLLKNAEKRLGIRWVSTHSYSLGIRWVCWIQQKFTLKRWKSRVSWAIFDSDHSPQISKLANQRAMTETYWRCSTVTNMSGVRTPVSHRPLAISVFMVPSWVSSPMSLGSVISLFCKEGIA